MNECWINVYPDGLGLRCGYPWHAMAEADGMYDAGEARPIYRLHVKRKRNDAAEQSTREK